MKPMTATAILALAAAMMTAPAMASGHRGAMMGAGPAAMLETLDFAQIDANGDGAITVDEWRAHVTARMDDRRAAMTSARVDALMEGDTDGDGALSRDELADRIAAMGDERRARMQQMRDERGQNAERGQRGSRAEGRGYGRHGAEYGGHQAGWRMGAMDADTGIVRSFQRMDRDADGRVTEAEFTQAVERMQQRAERYTERRARRQGTNGSSGN